MRGENDNDYHAETSEYDIDMLKEKDIEGYGLDPTSIKNRGLELLAEEELSQNGGDPINCDGQANYRSHFKSFKKALQCAIGDEKFTDFNKKDVNINDF